MARKAKTHKSNATADSSAALLDQQTSFDASAMTATQPAPPVASPGLVPRDPMKCAQAAAECSTLREYVLQLDPNLKFADCLRADSLRRFFKNSPTSKIGVSFRAQFDTGIKLRQAVRKLRLSRVETDDID